MRITAVVRRGRAAWKGPYFTTFPSLQDAIKHNTPIQTQARSCTILPNFVGLKFLVHNGKTYTPIHVTPEMVGHKLGEFAATRKPFKFKQTANK
ncbi:ribosomal protein S19 S15 [Atractiella rhizophila]|nr:ribosomal protein S19 S15 [Atractiella rhizophila]KAH8928906.1 ribosomal protein S19 S15 [Atractiella rhizophila]